jgi:phage protein|nr:MAG TPA: tail completion protein [Caudoviricetes sp.]DAU88229.1 MAG TPA: tail completion protein [Caudoviricetes sp.]
MIEITILNYLKNKMSVPVFLEHQKDEPEKFVIFEKTSSSNPNQTNSATFAFQSYANSMYEAAKINEELKKEIKNIVELNEIAFVKLNSDYNFTDTTTKKYRYQAIFDIKY